MKYTREGMKKGELPKLVKYRLHQRNMGYNCHAQ